MDDTPEDDRDEAPDDNMDEIPGDSTEDQEAEASEDNTEDEAERGRHLRNGFRILKKMHRNYKKFNPGAHPTWLKEEWQDLIEEGIAEVKGEYALIIQKTPQGIRVVRGPGKGTNWRGRTLKRCPCQHHQRLFRVLDSKDLSEAKKYHSTRGVLDLYFYLNPKDKGCGCKIGVEERDGDIIKLTWRGPRPDWGDVRHHVSNCISWLYMEKPSYHKNKRSGEKPPSMK